MKLAIVSPLPPAPTGIADYTMDVATALGDSHVVELFHDQTEASPSLPSPVFRIEELQARAASKPYDAVVYQMGNAPAHDFMYEWITRAPGVVVLHDLVLHHSYARRYLESPESQSYAADPSSREKRLLAEQTHRGYLDAVEATYPGQGQELKDAHFNSTGDLLPFAFPLFEPAIAGARAVGAHNSFMVEAIAKARPDLPCVQLAMPVQPMKVDADAIAALRARLGLRGMQPVVGCFGLVTREKRIETVARAVARIAVLHPGVKLLLAGPVADTSWLSTVLERARVSDRTIVTGRLEAAEFASAMAITDLVVHLRYPTARETSAALLRVMAQGRPVIISDLLNQSEIPEGAVRRVDPCDEEGDLTRGIDWALRNSAAAEEMGQRARRFAQSNHSHPKTRESYERLIACLTPGYSERFA